MTRRELLVERTGPGVFVEDLGRSGWAHLGVPRSGAADLGALRRANRIVGNLECAAGLEVLLGGLEFCAGAHLVVAVSGAACPLLLDRRPVPREAVLDVPPGSRLSLGTAEAGLRAYVAVRGGVDVPPVLGSRSWDTLAGLGPEPVRPGDVLPVGRPDGPLVVERPGVDVVPVAGPPGPDDVPTLRAAPGPRLNWLDGDALAHLWGRDTGWTVSAEADRVGLRLTGPVLSRDGCHRDAELPSEGLVRGAVQVPPGGAPVLFLADHPVTGGYPVVAVVLESDVDLAAQLRPGQRMRFARVDPSARPFRPDLRLPWWGW
jgi:biotin-dependent carboxylase-like uncharacterized protein